MIFLLGVPFDEKLLVRKALTSLYGISQNSTTFVKHRAPSVIRSLPKGSIQSPSASINTSNAKALSSSSSSTSGQQQQDASSMTPTAPSSTTSSSSSSQSKSQNTSIQHREEEQLQPPQSSARHNILSCLLAEHHIHPSAKLRELSETKIVALTASLSELTIEMDLKRRMQQNIARLRDMGSYRGRRHAMNLPVRGQRTRSQISTARTLNRIERRR